MAYGNYNGLTEKDEAFRSLFSRESVMESAWYKARLAAKQQRDQALWSRHKCSLEKFMASGIDRNQNGWRTTLCAVKKQLEHVSSAAYLTELNGTIGLEPSIFA
jgi:phosphoenolpyruvate carboxykinase (diphosphate)